MITKHPEFSNRRAGRRWPVLFLALALAMASLACVPDEDTFIEDNPPPPSYDDGTGGTDGTDGTTTNGVDLVVTIRGIAYDPLSGAWMLYRVRNNGNQAAGSFFVDLFGDLGSAPQVGVTFSNDYDEFSGLSAGASEDGAHQMDSFDDDNGTAYAVVDSLTSVSESNESNNVTSAFDWGPVESSTDDVSFDGGPGTQPSTISSSNDQDSSDDFYNWGFDSGTTASGAYSAKSGPISDDFTTCLDYDPGLSTTRIAFERTVSSELCTPEPCDYMQFYMDGDAIFFWSGEVAWDYFSFTFTSDQHDFSWCYEKDGSEFSGSDAAWVDEIEVQ